MDRLLELVVAIDGDGNVIDLPPLPRDEEETGATSPGPEAGRHEEYEGGREPAEADQ